MPRKKWIGTFIFVFLLGLCILPPHVFGQAASAHGDLLTWTPSASSTAVAQFVWRAPTASGPWTQIVMFNDNTTKTYLDENATGQPFYEVTAIDQSGNSSGPGNIAQAASAIPTNPLPPTGLAVASK